MRILFVSQMWPGPSDPDLGAYLVPVARELERPGNEVEVVAVTRRGGSRAKHARLVRDAVAAARRRRPDVVFAHYLLPAGVAGALAGIAGRAPLVVMAHGTDVANLGSIPGVEAATRWVIARASGVIANSRWLGDRLTDRIPAAAAKLEIASCGIDLDAFSPRDPAEARRGLGWEGEGPGFVCVGSLIERKNVVRLADAFARLGRGRLAFVGDGPLRGQLEGRPDVTVTGRLPQSEVPRWIAAADVVCQPSLREPFGQATLEGMAMERTVVATTVGGPPEFVPADGGVLVDPDDVDALTAALERAAAMPTPNPAARAAAAERDVRRETAKMEAVLERAVAR
ncbi:MAG TPA: glycosyltransferase [Solirubrobacterales bacterium]|nr:glycosyltransferase [Solirubrobacterales bacterium]